MHGQPVMKANVPSSTSSWRRSLVASDVDKGGPGFVDGGIPITTLFAWLQEEESNSCAQSTNK